LNFGGESCGEIRYNTSVLFSGGEVNSLDDPTVYSALDQHNMLSHIEALPSQLLNAWQSGLGLSLDSIHTPEKIIIAGMGGSAIGADLAAEFVHDTCPIPIIVQRDYGLPAWAKGTETLVIASSHSGNTEETISAYEEALRRDCQTIVIARGGKLGSLAESEKKTWWKFEHSGQPRSAVGWTFGLLIALFHRLGLIGDADKDFHATYSSMIEQKKSISTDIPLHKNPAKRQAGQLMGRWVCVVGSGILSPVSRRWKGQISEVAKAWGQFEFLPEIDHNTLAGTMYPAELMNKLVVLFLRADSDHKRNSLRSELTRQEFSQQGIGTDMYHAKGKTAMEQVWTAVQFGDYMSYYLAMLYGVDPTPITAMDNLKIALSQE